MNALRLAIGTLSIYPTPPPRDVGRRDAGWAMALAPLVAALLALPLWLVTDLARDRWSPFVLAVVWVAGLAVLTRGMHLDGLADTADGLGSRKPAETALAIMRRSDIGPFGVATVVLTLLLQVAATSQLLSWAHGASIVAAAVVCSRLVLPLLCASGVPGARVEGLGALVAGSVGPAQLGVAAATTAAVVVALGAQADDVQTALLGVIGVAAGLAYGWWCVRRLGGITGDVLGACVEVSLTGALLAMTLAL